jgi:transposase-like protein
MKRPRRNHSAAFKAKVALAALQGDSTLAELSQRFDVHANPITPWKQQLAANAATAFGEREDRQREGELERLHAKIGELTMERDFLQHAVGKLHGPTGKR